LHDNKKYTAVFENKSKKKERKVLIPVMMAEVKPKWGLELPSWCQSILQFRSVLSTLHRAPLLWRNKPPHFDVKMEAVWPSETLVLSIRLYGVI